MILRPRFKANDYRETIPGEGVFLLSESGAGELLPPTTTAAPAVASRSVAVNQTR